MEASWSANLSLLSTQRNLLAHVVYLPAQITTHAQKRFAAPLDDTHWRVATSLSATAFQPAQGKKKLLLLVCPPHSK